MTSLAPNAAFADTAFADAAVARAFFRDALGLPHVQGADGRPVFALPPATAGVHPAVDRSGAGTQRWTSRRVRPVLHLGCERLGETLAELLCAGASLLGFTADLRGHPVIVVVWVPGTGPVALNPHRT